MQTKDKISVIMGIYNCADTLPEAIDSIIAQTYENWELIMCDDASSDQTYHIAKQYQEKYPGKIKLLHNDVNSKLAYSLNRCLEFATGQFVARMDGDDLSTPDRFEKEIAYLKTHLDVQLVGTAMQQFDENRVKMRVIYKPEHPDRWTLHKQIPFHHATIMTYKYVYDALGGYTVTERTNRAQDYDLWFRFYAANYVGANLKEVLYYVREDIKAIKRRTFKVRWNALKTTQYGYRLLGYPKRWFVQEMCIVLAKSVIPFKFIEIYRKHQNQKGNSQEKVH